MDSEIMKQEFQWRPPARFGTSESRYSETLINRQNLNDSFKLDSSELIRKVKRKHDLKSQGDVNQDDSAENQTRV